MSDLNEYYKKIGSINLGVNNEDIILSEKEREQRELRINDLDEIINSSDVWDELVEKYKTPGNKINYTNVHNAILRHHHVYPIRHIGNNYDIDNFKFSYYHKDELVREVSSGNKDIVFGVSSGVPMEGTLYIGNTYQKFLDKENLSTDDFLQLGKSLYVNKDMMDFPTWELNIFGANGIIQSSNVEVAKVNTLVNDTKNHQYDMNNALLWCVSKGIPSRNGSVPINLQIDLKTFPDKATVFTIGNPNCKLNVDNELTKHAKKIIEHSNTLSEDVGHAFRKLFTVMMVIAIKTKNPPLYNNILCMLLTKLKSVSAQSGVNIVGMNVDCIEVDGQLNDKFIGKEIGKFKEVSIKV